jgi:ribosomal protein S6--L-glutamate ligase
MKVINEKSNISKSVEEFVAEGNRTIYIQKMLDLADRDYGVVFIGEKYLATYARLRSNSSWNTTTYSGGKYVKHEPSRQVLDIATRARELFDLDFTSVDIAETNEGIFLFEVSAFGAFRGLMEANNIDAADLYIEYVLKEIG